MDRDEIRPRDAVAVEENAIGAARGQDRTIANFGGEKSAVFLLDIFMPVSDLRLPGLDQLARGRGRAVVGNHDLEILVGLSRERPQHRRERICAVIGGDNDGNQLGHWRPII